MKYLFGYEITYACIRTVYGKHVKIIVVIFSSTNMIIAYGSFCCVNNQSVIVYKFAIFYLYAIKSIIRIRNKIKW